MEEEKGKSGETEHSRTGFNLGDIPLEGESSTSQFGRKVPDITGMDEKSAREYLLALLTTIKETKVKRRQLEKDEETWNRRVKLAEEKGEVGLKAQAELKVDQIHADIEQLVAEEEALLSELETVKRQLRIIKAQPEYTEDADLLLAQLEMAAGKVDETEEKFKQEEAEIALERLKKEMGLSDSE
ncbi:MAG: hypothetical protein DRP87_14920 [Spirochaetes bacterium]|nr:MAG: hypothetical protein DRP87_14920 [Spirochaetota bacterium]